jgi:hypothetical protein
VIAASMPICTHGNAAVFPARAVTFPDTRVLPFLCE